MTGKGLSEIDPAKLYPLAVFKERAGLGTTALRMARRAGLNVLTLHGRCYVHGAEFIRYATEAGKPSQE